MKHFTKTRLLPFLLVAITALCAFFGVILTTPNTVKADASTTPETIDYGSLPSKRLEEGDNLFGKYLLIRETNPSNEELWDSFTITTTGFSCEGEHITSADYLTFLSNEGALYFAVPYEFLGTYVVIDFTTEKTFETEDFEGNKYTLNYTEEDFVVTDIISSYTSAVILTPMDKYEVKEIKQGDSLSGKWIRIDANSNPLGWDFPGNYCQIIFDGGICLYYDEMSEPYICVTESGYEGGARVEIVDSLGQIDPETGDRFVSYIYIKLPENVSIFEETDEFGNGINYETNFIFQEFIGGEGAFENPVCVVAIEDEQPSDTPDTPTDGEQPEENNGNVKDKINEGSDKIADWLNDNTGLAFTGSGVLIIGAIILAVIFFKKK